jgi:hypothetical protein
VVRADARASFAEGDTHTLGVYGVQLGYRFESGALPPLPQTDYERAAERREHERECAGGNGFELRAAEKQGQPQFSSPYC